MSTKKQDPTGVLEDDVLESLQALVFGLKGRLRHGLGEQPLALAPMEMRALQFFVRHPGATQSDLVQHSGRDKAQIARLMKSLLSGGYLVAEPSPHDRRSQCLHPSPSGLALHQSLQKARREVLALSLQGLSPEELGQLLGLLKRLRSNLDAAPPTASPSATPTAAPSAPL